MTDKLKRSLAPIIFLLGAMVICPMTNSLIGIDMSSASEALKIYYWFVTVFLLFLALLSLPVKSSLLRNALKGITMFLLLIACVEFASALAFRSHYGQWSHNFYMNMNRFIFEPHPYLVGSLRKNAEYEREGLKYSHNSLGYRGDEFPIEKTIDKTRIVTIGGSTTYGVGVNNNETWPSHLSKILGSEYEVLNLGVAGYTTAENLIQTGLHMSDFEPDIAIYFVGLNDLRNVNVANLNADYSDFHAPSLHSALGLCPTENIPSLATLKMTLILFQKFGLIEGCPNQKMNVKRKKHAGVDERALSLYTRNLKSIVSICKDQNVKVLFVPHILLEEVLKTGNYNWWIPFIPNSEIDDMMSIYNSALKDVSLSTESAFADSVLNHNWTKDDFVDMSHFNDNANRRFAEILAKHVQALNTTEKSAITAAN